MPWWRDYQCYSLHLSVIKMLYLINVCFCCLKMLLWLVTEPCLFFCWFCWGHSVSLLSLIVFAVSASCRHRQNVDPEIKMWTKESSSRHNNTKLVLYMTTARQHQASQPQRTCTQNHQQSDITKTQRLNVISHIAAAVFLSFDPRCLAGLFCSSVSLFSSIQVRLDDTKSDTYK